MASSFLFLIHFLLFVFLPLNLEAAQEDERRCSHHGPSIRFPFWVKAFHPDNRYHYPGFELSCDKNKQTVLDLPNSVKLFVKKIDYKSRVIRLYDPDGCVPAKLPNLNLSASPFQFNEIYSINSYSLFNCSAPDRQIALSIPCLRASAYQVYAIRSFENVADYPLTSCSKIHNVELVPYNIFDQRGKLQLSWSKPNCSICESEGKICGLKDNTTEHEIECVAKSKKGSIHGLCVGSSMDSKWYDLLLLMLWLIRFFQNGTQSPMQCNLRFLSSCSLVLSGDCSFAWYFHKHYF